MYLINSYFPCTLATSYLLKPGLINTFISSLRHTLITLINTDTSLTSSEQSLKSLHLITHALTVYLNDLNEQLSQASISVLY